MAGKRIKALRKEARTEALTVAEAIAEVKKGATAKFDETVEMTIQLGVDPRKSDQVVRGVAPLPAGRGKTARVAVVCNEDKADDAKAAGANFAGADEVIGMIAKGDFSFDVLISEPSLMQRLSKHGKALGPKGLMPNPKSGTVTADIVPAVERAKSGQVTYRTERSGIVHAPIGLASFSEQDLEANFMSVLDSVKKAKPSAAKGQYLVNARLSSTMGPAVHIDVAPLR